MIVDKNTGEIIGGKFMKVFFDDIKKLFELSGSELGVLLLMMKSISFSNRNSINMTPKRKKEYANILGLKTFKSINTMLRHMEKVDIVKRLEPEDYPNEFTVNPELMFKGNEFNQVKMIITYTDGERKLEVRTGKD